MNVIKGLPKRDARDGEFVGIDTEIYQMSEPLHLPTGHLACATIALGDDVYLVERPKDVQESLRRVRAGTWAFHNANFDIAHLRRWVDVPERFIWDTMLVERHLFGGLYTRTFTLKDLARRWLSRFIHKETRDLFVVSDTMTEEMEEYAALDAWLTLRIAEKQQEYIHANLIDMRSYYMANAPAIWSFLDLQKVKIDVGSWMTASQDLSEEGDRLQEELGFNVNSPKQSVEFLNSILPLKKKLTSSRADKIEQYEDKDPRVGMLLRARSLIKMRTTYGASFIETVGPDGYIMPGWKLDGTVTGRAACADPNFQNVPVREFPQFREAVVASDGNVFIVSDASAQEPRIGAQLTQDPVLIELFNRGGLIYSNVSEEMFGSPVKKGTKRYDEIKAAALGSFYGLTPTTLARREKIPLVSAASIQHAFFTKFSKVPIWIHRRIEQIVRSGYIETPLGRRIWINIHDRSWENYGANYPIQSGAGEMTKLAMNYMHDQCMAMDIPYLLVLQVHDEIDCDVPKSLVKPYKKMLNDSWMEASKVIIPDIPMEIEMHTGQNWRCGK